MKKTILCCATALLCVAMLSYPLYKTSGELRNFSSALSYFSEAVSSDISDFTDVISSDIAPMYQGIVDAIEKTSGNTKYRIETVPAGENSFFIVDLDTGKIYSVTKTYGISDGLARIAVQSRSSFTQPGKEILHPEENFYEFD